MSYLEFWLKRFKEIVEIDRNTEDKLFGGESDFEDMRGSGSLPDPIQRKRHPLNLGVWGSREIHKKYEPMSFSYRPKKVKKYKGGFM